MKRIIFYIIIFILFTNCEKIIFRPYQYESLENVFEICWKEADLQYSYFTYRNIDWDNIYDKYKPEVHAEISEYQLFSILSNMLNELKDGHVNLYIKNANSGLSKEWFERYPSNEIELSKLIKNYLDEYNYANSIIGYGLINGELGYININSFHGDSTDYFIIDEIINDFNETTGIIIDVRSNGGGYSKYGDTIASRFADSKRLAYKYRFRDGPGHDDFTPWYNSYIVPADVNIYQKPVVILTNRRCYSATELFILKMRVLPNITVVGDTTGGLVGSPIFRELPNGWTFRLSNTQVVTYEMEYIEEVGLPPDIEVHLPVNETDIDYILEEAIEILSN
ncbi:MAG: S41 family peptidase [Bacteroidales bacterium]|nr:S41 family peptidase [Bacteroidales bacterium]